MFQRLSGSFFIVASAGFWGSATALSKGMLVELPAISLVLLQLIGSVVFLWSLCLFKGEHKKVSFKAVPGALLGVFEPGLAYLIGTIGLERTTASEASLLFAIEPAFVFLFAAIFFGFKPRLTDLCLLGIAIWGVCLVGLSDSGISSQRIIGNSLVITGTAIAGLYVVLSRYALVHSSVLLAAALQHTVALLLVLCAWPFMAQAGELDLLFTLSVKSILSVLCIGIVQYSLAFLCYLKSIEQLPVCTAAMFLNLIPVFGMGVGAALLGERLMLAQWIGAAMLLSAITGFAKQKAQIT